MTFAKLGTYTKFIVALVGAVLTTVVSQDWGFNFPQWVSALSATLTALAVFAFPNKPYVQLDEGQA